MIESNTFSHVNTIDTIDSPYLIQEKRYQSLEHQRQLQELTFVREEKRQLGNELEALRSKDKQLRDRIGQLEAILHKVAPIYTSFVSLLLRFGVTLPPNSYLPLEHNRNMSLYLKKEPYQSCSVSVCVYHRVIVSYALYLPKDVGELCRLSRFHPAA